MERFTTVVHWIADWLTIPNLLLGTILVVGLWILKTAQARPEFEVGQMLVDENGKPSSSRFAVFICLGLTSYLLAYAFITKDTVSDETLFYMFLAYIVTWASSKTLERAIEAWLNRGNSSSRPQLDSPIPRNQGAPKCSCSTTDRSPSRDNQASVADEEPGRFQKPFKSN